MAHYECKYCDSPLGPLTIEGEEVCRCGAEWADAKIMVEDDDIDYDYDEEDYDNYDEDEDGDGDICVDDSWIDEIEEEVEEES